MGSYEPSDMHYIPNEKYILYQDVSQLWNKCNRETKNKNKLC